MKKLFIVSALTFLFMGNVYAQQGQRTEEERAQMRAEMIKRVADRSAKDFDLKGDAKEACLSDRNVPDEYGWDASAWTGSRRKERTYR